MHFARAGVTSLFARLLFLQGGICCLEAQRLRGARSSPFFPPYSRARLLLPCHPCIADSERVLGAPGRALHQEKGEGLSRLAKPRLYPAQVAFWARVPRASGR